MSGTSSSGKYKLLLPGVFITSVFISSGIKLLFFQLLRFLKQQYGTFFPATGKFTLLEKYPDISKIGETHLSLDSSKPQEESAIPLYHKLASVGATGFNPHVSIFCTLA